MHPNLVSILLAYILTRIAIFFWRRHKRYNLFKYYHIKGPKPQLFTGGNFNLYYRQLGQLRADEECRRLYGKTYGVFIGDQPFIMTTDLNLLHQVFLDNMGSFKERFKLVLELPLSESILFAQHNRWRFMRKILTPTFNAYKMRGDSSLEFVEQSIKLMMEYLDGKFEESSGERRTTVDIHDLFKATSLHLISSLAINLPHVEVKEQEENVCGLEVFLSSVSESGAQDLALKYPFFKRFLEPLAKHLVYNKALAKVHAGLEASLQETLKCLRSEESNEEQHKLMDVLAEQYKAGKMTHSEVIANGVAILIAGYDTTSTTLTYVMWALAKYPSVQAKLRTDLMTYGTNSQYLDCILNETMRLYPVLPYFITRIATETIDLSYGKDKSICIPQGTGVVYNSWLIGRDPNIWSNPLKFDPSRFEEPQVGQIHPCAFAPFGLGERKCLGFRLARLEMKMFVCDLVLGFNIRLVSPLVGDVLELVAHCDVLSKPKEKVILELEKL